MQLPVIEPMTLTRIAAPFDRPDFLFELKHDGFRCLAYISENRCDVATWFPAVNIPIKVSIP